MMTQGHEPHGDGGGREKLLIKVLRNSYSYHRTDSVIPPMADAYITTSLTPFGNQEQTQGGVQGEPGVRFTWEAFLFKWYSVQFGQFGVS